MYLDIIIAGVFANVTDEAPFKQTLYSGFSLSGRVCMPKDDSPCYICHVCAFFV